MDWEPSDERQRRLLAGSRPASREEEAWAYREISNGRMPPPSHAHTSSAPQQPLQHSTQPPVQIPSNVLDQFFANQSQLMNQVLTGQAEIMNRATTMGRFQASQLAMIERLSDQQAQINRAHADMRTTMTAAIVDAMRIVSRPAAIDLVNSLSLPAPTSTSQDPMAGVETQAQQNTNQAVSADHHTQDEVMSQATVEQQPLRRSSRERRPALKAQVQPSPSSGGSLRQASVLTAQNTSGARVSHQNTGAQQKESRKSKPTAPQAPHTRSLPITTSPHSQTKGKPTRVDTTGQPTEMELFSHDQRATEQSRRPQANGEPPRVDATAQIPETKLFPCDHLETEQFRANIPVAPYVVTSLPLVTGQHTTEAVDKSMSSVQPASKLTPPSTVAPQTDQTARAPGSSVVSSSSSGKQSQQSNASLRKRLAALSSRAEAYIGETKSSLSISTACTRPAVALSVQTAPGHVKFEPAQLPAISSPQKPRFRIDMKLPFDQIRQPAQAATSGAESVTERSRSSTQGKANIQRPELACMPPAMILQTPTSQVEPPIRGRISIRHPRGAERSLPGVLNTGVTSASSKVLLSHKLLRTPDASATDRADAHNITSSHSRRRGALRSPGSVLQSDLPSWYPSSDDSVAAAHRPTSPVELLSIAIEAVDLEKTTEQAEAEASPSN